MSGESVTYQYDSLNRLASATAGSTWGESYSYDGFGNLTAKTVTAGSGPSLSVSFDANNHITSVFGLTYDANGNQSGANYDAENRISSILQGQSYLYYCYDAQNRRIFSWNSTLDPLNNRNAYTVYYYTPGGQKLGAYQFNVVQTGPPTMFVTLMTSDRYFGAKRLAPQDRLGSAGDFYPWGEPKGANNPQDTWSYATYWRDSASGLDYANNRYYSNQYARFMTPDPYQASGGSADPQSWNRYSYTRGDPVNRGDPAGTCDVSISFYGDDTFYTNCDPSLGSDLNPAAYTVCLATPGCYQPLAGGGNPAAAHITPLVAPSTTQNQQQALDAGIDAAWAHIINNPDCIGFLTGNPGAGTRYVAGLVQLATTLWNTTYRFAPLPSGTAAQTFSVNQVTISTSGSFFSPPTIGNAVFVNMPNAQGVQGLVGFNSVATLDASILLHELGHQMGVLPADENDAQNGANSAAILSNCFTKKGSLYQ